MMRGPAGTGGGNMRRVVGWVVGAGMGGMQDLVSTGDGARARRVSVNSSPPSSPSCAAERADWQQRYLCFCDGDGWEPVGEEEAEEAAAEYGFGERFVFGPAPSPEEVADAVSTIQQIFTFSEDIKDLSSSTVDKDINDKTVITDSIHRVPSSGSESDWIEPAFELCSGNNFQSQARQNVIDAFHLLQINPLMKKTVISLSSDKAVWDAVMKNEAVQELRKSIYAAEGGGTANSDGDDNASTRILRIFQSTKARIMEFMEKITKIVSELFLSEKDKKVDLFQDALRSSVMLSVVVFIIVGITRAHKGP